MAIYTLMYSMWVSHALCKNMSKPYRGLTVFLITRPSHREADAGLTIVYARD
jgi:hypothetical protein